MAQNEIWLVVGLLTVTIPLVAIARRANVPYPVVLVLGGLVLGFTPGLPRIELDPNLVLIIFLPPLLYWEAITAPTDVMRANAGQIWVLAIGLVVATTVTVAVVAHASIPALVWPMAFVLGAIVAPTDELASAPVLERMRMPRHLIAIVQGESLLNDASSLILYGVAVTAATTGAFNVGHAMLQFLVAAVGAIVLGLAVARLAIEGWRRITDTQLQGVISFNLPFLTYALAQRFGLSGVLAVVYAGTYANRFTPTVITPAARLQVSGYWETVVFLANALLFLLVGLQLHELGGAVLAEYSWQAVLWYALLVNLTVIGTRFAWVMLQEFIPVIGAASEHPQGDWKHAFVASWSGLRGAVSLAAALAIPVTVAGGAHLPHRDLVIFLTFTVILVTLVGGGLTLPLVIRRLRIPEGSEEENQEIRRATVGMSQAALARIGQLEHEGRLPADDVRRLRRRYEHDRRHVDGHLEDERERIEAEREVLAAERSALIEMRERGEIDNTVLRRLQRVLDIAEERLRHHAEASESR
jgi:CPA1 family monovalent cation:H+ antiporter